MCFKNNKLICSIISLVLIIFLSLSCNRKSPSAKLSQNNNTSNTKQETRAQKYLCNLIIKTNDNLTNTSLPEIKVSEEFNISEKNTLTLLNEVGNFFAYQGVVNAILDNTKQIKGLELNIYGSFIVGNTKNPMQLFSKGEFEAHDPTKAKLTYIHSKETIILECITQLEESKQENTQNNK